MKLIVKIAFETGASGGIGFAYARLWQKNGADITLCYRSNEDAAARLVQEIREK